MLKPTPVNSTSTVQAPSSVTLTHGEKLIEILENSQTCLTDHDRQLLKSSLMDIRYSQGANIYVALMLDGSKLDIDCKDEHDIYISPELDDKRAKKFTLNAKHPAWDVIGDCVSKIGIIQKWQSWALAPCSEGEFRQEAYRRLRYCIKNSCNTLALSGLGLTTLPPVPDGIHRLDVSYNRLNKLPEIPFSLLVLDISNNLLTTRPIFTRCIESINLTNNPFSSEIPTASVIPGDITMKKPPNLLSETREHITPDARKLVTLLKKTGKYTEDSSLHTKIILMKLAAWRAWKCEATSPGEKRGEAYERLKKCLMDDSCELSLKGLNLSALPPLPNSLLSLDLSDNNLTRMPPLPATLKTLNIRNNKLPDINRLPQGLLQLDVRNNKLKEVPLLPPGLISLNIRTNMIRSLPALPTTLITLKAQNNLLSELPSLPPLISKLYVSNNKLISIPQLPEGLKFLDVAHNSLTGLPPIPDATIGLDASYNMIQEKPILPQTLQYVDAKFNPYCTSAKPVEPDMKPKILTEESD